jgi:hypothetical protein
VHALDECNDENDRRKTTANQILGIVRERRGSRKIIVRQIIEPGTKHGRRNQEEELSKMKEEAGRPIHKKSMVLWINAKRIVDIQKLDAEQQETCESEE